MNHIEGRLEALELAKLNSELILFGVRELPSESTLDVVISIAAALGVAVAPGEISSCTRIPTRGDRPRPIIVRLSSNDVRNRIDGKRARGVLEGAEVSATLSGSRIDVNERLPTSVRAAFGEARRAVREGRLHRSWVRNGRIYVRRHVDTSPVRVRHLDHLRGLIAGPPPPTSSSTAGASAAVAPAMISASHATASAASLHWPAGGLVLPGSQRAPVVKPRLSLAAPGVVPSGVPGAGRVAAARPPARDA